MQTNAVPRPGVIARARRVLRAMLICGFFGALYGTVAGSIFGGCVTMPLVPIGSPVAMLYGGFCGMLGGFAGGLFCGLFRGPIGWGIGGLIGGAAAFPLLNGGFRADYWTFNGFEWFLTIVPAIIGAALLGAVGYGIRKGESRLPAVSHLIEALDHRPAAPGKTPGGSEVAPVSASEAPGAVVRLLTPEETR